ncbi:hypothetical protein AAIB33_16665 [Microbacterium sp. AZCO]|uniref:hypothetical protein n=1 Tax=Microbacterium sp. AZCO TaxID=3142976 RepID=UPI0031F3E815
MRTADAASPAVLHRDAKTAPVLEESSVLDVIYVVATIALFALVALVARGIERL